MKIKKNKKERKLRSLIKEADQLFSKEIRRRYSDCFGNVSCVTCGVIKPVKEIQAGHYVSRDLKNGITIRYSDLNVHPQCYGCNVMKSGAKEVYAIFLMKKYGKEILQQLDEMRSIKTNNRVFLEKIIEKYKGEKNEH